MTNTITFQRIDNSGMAYLTGEAKVLVEDFSNNLSKLKVQEPSDFLSTLFQSILMYESYMFIVRSNEIIPQLKLSHKLKASIIIWVYLYSSFAPVDLYQLNFPI